MNPTSFKFKIIIREFERGWGSKTLAIQEFDSYEEAVAGMNKVNSLNTASTAPDYYEQAEALNFSLSE